MNIQGLELSSVLAALYNAASSGGLALHEYDPAPMSIDEADGLLKQYGSRPYFDYIRGRSMKIGLMGEDVNTKWYNVYNGAEAAEHAITILRETGNPADPRIVAIGVAGTQKAIEEFREVDPSRTTELLLRKK